MIQQMTETILIKTEKSSLNLSKQWNITNCSAAAESIHLEVHVCRNWEGRNIEHYVHFSILINSQIFKTVKQKGWNPQNNRPV